MAVYLIGITPPYFHARHYIGFTTKDPERRLADHKAGRDHASRLLKAAHAAGHQLTILHVWEDGCRRFEAWLKRRADVRKWCPCCGRNEVRMPEPSRIPSTFDGATKRARRNRLSASQTPSSGPPPSDHPF
jgi:predicted GIY-YIG superfamily endonuclease